MKNIKYLIIGIIFLFIIIGIYFFANKSKSNTNSSNTANNNIEYSRTSTEESNNTNSNTSIDNSNNNIPENTNNTNETNQAEPAPVAPTVSSEEDLASFSTKIYSKDSSRQKNMQITSQALNGTIVEPGKTFSFTKTVGKSTKEKGYEKADVYDSDGNKVKGYGGGNCQVSSTLYNAVLKLPSLNVTERHPHSNKVPYVEENKDAAVAYGSIDFKFINNYNYKIKIYSTVDKKNVTVRIVKLNI